MRAQAKPLRLRGRLPIHRFHRGAAAHRLARRTGVAVCIPRNKRKVLLHLAPGMKEHVAREELFHVSREHYLRSLLMVATGRAPAVRGAVEAGFPRWARKPWLTHNTRDGGAGELAA